MANILQEVSKDRGGENDGGAGTIGVEGHVIGSPNIISAQLPNAQGEMKMRE